MTEIKTSDLREAMETSLPDGYILSRDVVFPDHEVPIKASVNGKKVTVGSGRVDPETGVFTGTLDAENEHANVLRGQIESGSEEFSYHPFLNVSEVELSSVRQIEKISVLPTGHAIIEGDDSPGPMPRFHDHD